jgi:nucleoside-diphosphate-sugar epimerase
MTNNTPSVLILGAHGRLGQALTLAFANAGWQVRAQSRKTYQNWPAGVESVPTDAMHKNLLIRAAQGVDVIINALNPLYTEWDKFAAPLAANALAAAKSSGALLMFPGNVYNFGCELPDTLHENTPQIGNTPKARIRIEIEQLLRDAANDDVNSVVIRSGDFFGGKVRGSWFDLVLTKSLHQGKLVYPGATDVLHAWTYLPDLAETYVRVAQQRLSLQGAHCFHFAGHGVTGGELHQALQLATGCNLRLAGLPWWLIRLVAPFASMPKAILEMRYLWQRPHVLDDSVLKAKLGDVPFTPLVPALADSLADLGMQSLQPPS